MGVRRWAETLMKRCIPPRLLLALLLQLLFIATPVHASPPHHRIIVAAQGHPQRCATRNVLSIENEHNDSSASPGESNDVASPLNMGCCSPSGGACGCPSTAVVSVTLVSDAGVVADRPTVAGLAALTIEVRTFALYRPPI